MPAVGKQRREAAEKHMSVADGPRRKVGIEDHQAPPVAGLPARPCLPPHAGINRPGGRKTVITRGICEVVWRPSESVPPVETDFGRCAASGTDSHTTDASIPETSTDYGTGLSPGLSDLSPTSENTGLTVPTDGESAVLESDVSSETTSLPADAEDYLAICGRLFPNPKYGWSWYAKQFREPGTEILIVTRRAIDEEALEVEDRALDFHLPRQDFQLFRSPISAPTRVLDLKTGSGYWVDKVALVEESADVVGMDIAPVQRATEPNCLFLFDNFNWEWNRAPRSFDLIRGDKLLGNVQDWARLFRNSFNCLRPDGFFELCGTPFSYTSNGGAIDAWNSVSRQAYSLGNKIGCSFVIVPGVYTEYMTAAGFVDIYEEWETTEVTEFVLHDIECMLRLAWHLEGVDHEKIATSLVNWRRRLESEASSVEVQHMGTKAIRVGLGPTSFWRGR
ncbi:hypothetical protein VTK56DRAFT_4311 [Thermocarpiscus australiensis]